ncbi:uncharacterized protein LOC123784388 [Ursus americanus]|uniref:uncharacterized protein LOC123784388 n=1 Tax=Ursus americanus TaxID=9643 RepID=UPI001E67C195|nr:uncharacterized protein LOC123784388 [Ursus americanus]
MENFTKPADRVSEHLHLSSLDRSRYPGPCCTSLPPPLRAAARGGTGPRRTRRRREERGCGRAASEALKVSLADIAAEPRTQEAAAAAAVEEEEEEEAAAEAEGRPGPKPSRPRTPAGGPAAATALGSAADLREELAGAPGEDGAAGSLRGVSLTEPEARSRGGLGEFLDCELFQNSVLRTHYFNSQEKHIQKYRDQLPSAFLPVFHQDPWTPDSASGRLLSSLSALSHVVPWV